ERAVRLRHGAARGCDRERVLGPERDLEHAPEERLVLDDRDADGLGARVTREFVHDQYLSPRAEVPIEVMYFVTTWREELAPKDHMTSTDSAGSRTGASNLRVLILTSTALLMVFALGATLQFEFVIRSFVDFWF